MDTMKLSLPQKELLLAIANGNFLKSHRDTDGNKVFQLHPLEGEAQAVRRETVEALADLGLINSNQKFPAATFWLTENGKTVAAKMKL